MIPVEALTYALLVAAACTYLIWLLPGPCRCEQCSYHVNERRMARMRAAEEAEKAQAERKAERKAEYHEFLHKGAMPMPDEPDRFNCRDITCPRNHPR